MTTNNHITVLKNGDEIFPSMLDAIQQAKSSIIFLTYVYWRGDIADQFAHRLADKAREGIKVSVLIDAFGGNKIDSALLKHMREAGIEVRWFRPLRWYTIHKFNNRTHRKILVCDEQIGFVGGVGIADEWTGDAQDFRHWRDTHFKITGDAAHELIDSFNENWKSAGGKPIGYGPSSPAGAGKGIEVRVTSSTHGVGRTKGAILFNEAIAAAKQDVMITTAYFVPNRRFIRALTAASRRGVTVSILTNGPHTNQYLARKAGHHAYTRLMFAGVNIYEYQKTLLHAKVMTIDHTSAIVGSSNFDDRSFVLNDEVCVSFSDPAVVKKLDLQYQEDLTQARHISLPRWQERALRSKLMERLSAFISGQL